MIRRYEETGVLFFSERMILNKCRSCNKSNSFSLWNGRGGRGTNNEFLTRVTSARGRLPRLMDIQYTHNNKNQRKGIDYKSANTYIIQDDSDVRYQSQMEMIFATHPK